MAPPRRSRSPVALALSLALLALPLAAPAAALTPGPGCGADAALCPPMHGVAATCRGASLVVAGSGPGPTVVEGAVEAVATDQHPSTQRDASVGPVDHEVTLGDVRIVARGVRVSCHAAWVQSAPTTNHQRFARGDITVQALEVHAPAGSWKVQGLRLWADLYDPGWGLQRNTDCTVAHVGVLAFDLVANLVCLPGLAQVHLGPARVGFAARWGTTGNAAPGLAIEGIAAAMVSVATEDGEQHLYVGAATAGLQPFALPGPN